MAERGGSACWCPPVATRASVWFVGLHCIACITRLSFPAVTLAETTSAKLRDWLDFDPIALNIPPHPADDFFLGGGAFGVNEDFCSNEKGRGGEGRCGKGVVRDTLAVGRSRQQAAAAR